LLFGSDLPLLPARRYIDALAEADLTAAERALIMGGNAMRLLGL
jgi:predicted TIM-barrel fold metal-dependent hydrolase